LTILTIHCHGNIWTEENSPNKYQDSKWNVKIHKKFLRSIQFFRAGIRWV
jgi:hypothetical protein